LLFDRTQLIELADTAGIAVQAVAPAIVRGTERDWGGNE
jgi:hypothetical protein